MADSDFQDRLYVSVRQFVGTNKKTVLTLAPVDSVGAQVHGELMSFELTKPSQCRCHVGNVYSIPTHKDNGSLRLASAVYKGEYADATQVMQWQAEQVSRALLQKAHRRNDASTNERLNRSIEQIKVAYDSVRPQDKLAFKLWLINQLDRW